MADETRFEARLANGDVEVADSLWGARHHIARRVAFGADPLNPTDVLPAEIWKTGSNLFGGRAFVEEDLHGRRALDQRVMTKLRRRRTSAYARRRPLVVAVAFGALLLVPASVLGALDASTGAGEQPELALSRTVSGSPPRRDVIVVDAAGKVLRRIAGASSSPAWSPDGSRLAYVGTSGSRRDLRTDIFVVGATGGTPRRLTSSGRAVAPVWSPDGQRIVFAQATDAKPPSGARGVWAVAAGGGRPRALLPAKAGRFDLPSSFSPDGSQLALTRCTLSWPDTHGRVANTCAVHLLDMRTLALRKLVDRAADAAFSPDGTQLAVVTDRDENGEISANERVFSANELYVLNADGSDMRRLTQTDDLDERTPSWSPDGRLIAYTKDRSVFTIVPDGSCPRVLAGDPGGSVSYRGPAWRPGRVLPEQEPACAAADAAPALVPLAGNLTLAQARRFRDFGLYWLGRRFEQYQLSSVERMTASAPGGRGPVVSLAYGAFGMQLWPACARLPSHVAPFLAAGKIRLRGVDGFFFEGGSRLEIVTGKTNIVMFGERSQLIRAARALQPLNPPTAGGTATRLPTPAPGVLAGKIRCP